MIWQDSGMQWNAMTYIQPVKLHNEASLEVPSSLTNMREKTPYFCLHLSRSRIAWEMLPPLVWKKRVWRIDIGSLRLGMNKVPNRPLNDSISDKVLQRFLETLQICACVCWLVRFQGTLFSNGWERAQLDCQNVVRPCKQQNRQAGGWNIKSYHIVSNCVFYPVSDVDWWNLVRFEDVVFPFDFIKLSHRVCQTNLRSPVWPTSSMA